MHIIMSYVHTVFSQQFSLTEDGQFNRMQLKYIIETCKCFLEVFACPTLNTVSEETGCCVKMVLPVFEVMLNLQHYIYAFVYFYLLLFMSWTWYRQIVVCTCIAFYLNYSVCWRSMLSVEVSNWIFIIWTNIYNLDHERRL